MGSPVPVVPFRKPYDWKVGAVKASKTAAVVVVPLLLEHFSHEDNVKAFLGPEWIGLAGVIAGAIRFYANRRKQQG